MHILFRRLLVCLLWLWLPVSQAADSGWLRAADNQHASVRLRAQTQDSGETRLLLDVALEKGWKTYWRSPGEGGLRPPSPGRNRWRLRGAGRRRSVLRWPGFRPRAITATSAFR